jgi:hypothetical protein
MYTTEGIVNDVILSIVVSGTLASIVSSVIAYSLGIKKRRESLLSPRRHPGKT